MTDAEVIQAAYEEQLAELFDVFFANLLEADGETGDVAMAEEAFQAGLHQARHARDRALTLL